MNKNTYNNKNRKSNIVLSLIFSSIILLGTVNVELNKQFQSTKEKEQFELSKNLEFISATATSDVKKEVLGKLLVSYLVDLDFDNDGKTDKTVSLVDNVKYVSTARLNKINKIKKDSKLVFECDIKSHVEMPDSKTELWPKIVVDDISTSSAVGLIDNLVIIDENIIKPARRTENMEYLNFLDKQQKNSETGAVDNKIDSTVFEYFYNSNLRAR